MTQTQILLPEPITIQYALSQKGQEAALAAGVDPAREQSVSGQITLATLKRLGLRLNDAGMGAGVNVLRVGSVEKPITKISADNPPAVLDAPETFDQILARLLDLVAAQQAAREAKAAATDAAVRAAIADVAAEKVDADVAFASEGLRAEWYAVRDARAKARAEAEKQARAAREAKKAAMAEAKAAELAEWVARLGTENQKQRHAAGLLPSDEALNLIKDYAFTPLADFPRYKLITEQEVRNTCAEECECNYNYDDNCEVSFNAEDAQDVSAQEWDAMQAIRAVPALECCELVAVTLRRHRGQCDECDAPQGYFERPGIYVKMRSGAFTFNQEYAIPAQ